MIELRQGEAAVSGSTEPPRLLTLSPSWPNAIDWSSENLVAVASGHLITILNPAALEGPRELVVLRPNNPFPIRVISL
ncbi:hypothetical protein GUJ93_ZPchr0007g5110 [Zizania palustris]|uniref:Uncharacterized protein n=1 Tax=Zizania palustris TaxID=103762 RepID=A0A8J5SPR6_ZIZPA|nr:hypothetical protein GUJ93_ZPchr0007g5110 [Zizania palustris]